MGRFYVLVLALAAVGCSKKNQNDGLPPAKEWGTDPSGGAAPHAANPHTADMNDPHAGVDMGDNPHAGVEMGDNPHAGVDMTNPHGAAGAATDVSKLGLSPPDPNRAADPSHHVTGVIRIHPKARDRVKAGTPVFVIVKQDVNGAASGPPLAVDKLTWGANNEIPFRMTEAQAMIAGTQLTGSVIVVARYDQDSDALTKQPGDIIGETHVKVPADNVVLTLDNVLP